MLHREPQTAGRRLDYPDFIGAKAVHTPHAGIEVAASELNPILLPHHSAAVLWALAGGRRAIFALFGLGKSVMQLEIARLLLQYVGGRFLIILPLGVRQEFFEDANMLATGDRPTISEEKREQLRAWQQGRPDRIPKLKFIQSIEECGPTGIYCTNYETIREGKLNPKEFSGASLDEADILRGFGGSKTFRQCMRLFEGMPYKFVATATPSPNEYIELLAYSAFLEVADVSQIKTRFFKRDSEQADNLSLYQHKIREFWIWMSTWALFLQRPSDLGPQFSDEGYDLPDLEIHWHEIPSNHENAGFEANGQGRLVKNAALGVVDASREKRDSLGARLQKVLELRALDPEAHRIIWHDLEDERRALEKAIPGIATVWGTQDMRKREQTIVDFSHGRIPEMATKAKIAGAGCNFQRHCAWAIFMGIGFKFRDFIQAIKRIHRFLQTKTVRIDLIYTEAEREVRRALEEKWAQHNKLMEEMSKIIREFGIAEAAVALKRSIGVERIEVSGDGWRLVNNDCVLETRRMPADSVHLICSSIPFSTQYEYSPSFHDFGHSDSNEHFWQQMDYLLPELLRVLQPGRDCVIHVKDRIVPGGINKLGFQTIYPFHCDAIARFQHHGFALIGFKTIVTDVVRENEQTRRLGWTEQCKDGTRMGYGMSEYLLLFRKPPSDNSNGYADHPVRKDKPNCITAAGEEVPFHRNLPIRPGTGYSRSRWQIDAHGFSRSSGDRQLRPEEIERLPHAQIFKLFREYSRNEVYNFEHHVRLGETLEAQMRLPVKFMLLQPQSWHPDVWTDITRMLTLNGAQSAKGKELHLCPMQTDLADRAITQMSMPGEIVYDPFSGLGTVPYRAVLLGRQGLGVELSPSYFFDAVQYLKAAEKKVSMPSLFDALELEAADEAESLETPA